MRLSSISPFLYSIFAACGPVLEESDLDGYSSDSEGVDSSGDTAADDDRADSGGLSESGDDAGDIGDSGPSEDDAGTDESDADDGDSDGEDVDDGEGSDDQDSDGGESSDDDGDSEEDADASGDGEDDGDSGDTGDESGEDSGGSDGDDSDSSGDDGGLEPCQIEQFAPLPPNVLLLLDKSGSMSLETWDHDQDPKTPEVTRWNTLHGAVAELTANFEDRVKFGAKLFPQLDATGVVPAACVVTPGVEVPCAFDNSANVMAGLPLAGATLQGGTPIESGLEESINYFHTLPAVEPKAIVLVADGGISCDEDFDAAVNLVAGAAGSGIPTYVLGIDPDPNDPYSDNDPYDQLNALAQAGGVANPSGPPDFYPVQNQADLDALMEAIITQTMPCVVDIDPEPTSSDLIEFRIAGQDVPRIQDCNTESGWQWTQQYPRVEFCNMACIDLKAEGSVEARYFCRP